MPRFRFQRGIADEVPFPEAIEMTIRQAGCIPHRCWKLSRDVYYAHFIGIHGCGGALIRDLGFSRLGFLGEEDRHIEDIILDWCEQNLSHPEEDVTFVHIMDDNEEREIHE